jgi:hypothetical protein
VAFYVPTCGRRGVPSQRYSGDAAWCVRVRVLLTWRAYIRYGPLLDGSYAYAVSSQCSYTFCLFYTSSFASPSLDSVKYAMHYARERCPAWRRPVYLVQWRGRDGPCLETDSVERVRSHEKARPTGGWPGFSHGCRRCMVLKTKPLVWTQRRSDWRRRRLSRGGGAIVSTVRSALARRCS